jgi:uncharacterized protein (UPF0332 family)
MSQAENKMKWCLKKAQDALKEGKRHRGLVKTEPNLEEAKKHVEKAEHNFKAIMYFEKSPFSDWSVSACFYTIYHCFLAIIAKFGYESRNQECTIALVENLKEEGKIEINEEIIEALKISEHEEVNERNVIEMRENFQYGTQTSIENSKLNILKELCRKAIEETKESIYSLKDKQELLKDKE